MNTGKLQESILDRSVFKQLHSRREEVLCKPKVGWGYQLLHADKALVAVTTNVVEGSAPEVAMLAVPRGVNSLVCSNAQCCGLMIAFVLPKDLEEKDFRMMMLQIETQCAAENIQLMGGHTQVSREVSCVIATVTALGFRDNEKIALPRPGQSIVMTKWAGLSGTWLLERRLHDAFCAKYNPDLGDSIREFSKHFLVSREAALAMEYGERTLFDLSEGGVFGGLWEVAAAGNVGLCVDLKKIPLKQETVELCDFADINPYQLVSAGSLLIASDSGERLVQKLQEAGIAAAVIGEFTQGHDRVIINDDEVRYLEPPRVKKVV